MLPMFVQKGQTKHAQIFRPYLLKIRFLTDWIMIDQICIHFLGFSADVYEGLEFLQGEQLIIECRGISQYLFHICMCKHYLS